MNKLWDFIMWLDWPAIRMLPLCFVIAWCILQIEKAIKQSAWYLKTHFYSKDEEVDD